MPQVEVEYVEHVHEPGLGTNVFRVAQVVTHDDGRTDRILRIIPTFAVAARMAEYACDQEQAVRLLLAEPYMPDRPATPQIYADPIWRRGAAEHVEAAERTVAELGFDPLDLRAVPDGDDVEHPARVMVELDVPAELVSELRFRHAEQRAAWRDATAVAASLASARPRKLGLPPAARRTAAQAATAG